MNVVWTESATSQLQAIRDSATWKTPGYGLVLSGKIVERSEGLAYQPYLGGEVPEYGDSTIRELFEHPHRILYTVVASEVQILAVIHAARLLPHTPAG